MSAGRTLTGKHVLMVLIGFFATIMVANIIFITLAVKSFPGESQKKSYMHGLQYNDVLANRSAQAALGWRAVIFRIEQGKAGATIELRFYDSSERPISNLIITGDIRRPVHDENDHILSFEEAKTGQYVAITSQLNPGAWDLSVHATGVDNETFHSNTRIQIR